MRFSIKLIPLERGPDYDRLGVITVGNFTERFACHPVFAGSSLQEVERQWHAELRRLIAGEAAVLLAHDPRFAWAVYREGPDCYVQQHMFLDGVPVDRNLRTHLDRVPSRCVLTEDARPISEWATSIEAIEQFLDSS